MFSVFRDTAWSENKGQSSFAKRRLRSALRILLSCHVMIDILCLIETESAIDPLTLKTLPGTKPNWIGWSIALIWPFEIRHITSGVFGTHILGKGIVGSRRSCHLRWWFPIGSPLWPVTIRPKFAIPCLRVSNAQEVDQFESKFLMLWSAESEHYTLTNRDFLEEFQPM